MKVGYFLKKLRETFEDVTFFKDVDSPYEEKKLVIDACNHAWNANVSWEFPRDVEIVTLVIDNVEKGDFKVKVEWEEVECMGTEYVPVFSVIE